MKREDLSGRLFGRLTVLYEVHRHFNGRLQWACQCVCGKQLIVLGYNLRMGQTRSCGCLKIDQQSKPAGVAARNRILRSYRQNAKKRGPLWNLSATHFEQLLIGNCFYCNLAPSTISKDTTYPLKTNGIDRRNSSQGYIEGNVVSCCPQCNWAKRDRTVDEFYAWIASIARYRSTQ